MYKVGDWVSYVGPEGSNYDGANGIVIDYIGGGPEYPPCIVVAWQHVRSYSFTHRAKWWSVAKAKLDEIKLYKGGV